MPRFLFLFALFLVASCQPLPPYAGWDPAGVNCQGNTEPFIQNVQVNSAYLGEEDTWVLVVGFNWADPGRGGASDPPNLDGGEFSVELSDFIAEDTPLTTSVLETGCGGDPDPEIGTANYCGLVNVGSGCPNGGVDSCATASLAVPILLTPTSSETVPLEGDPIEIALRIRDRCGMTSNSKGTTYFLGQGLIIEEDGS